MNERREAIRKFIETQGEISIAQLAAAFPDWSEMTLRRDLANLEQSRQIVLTRGGARWLPARTPREDIYSERERRNFSAKQLIAAKAAKLIEPGSGIFIDSGTTGMALARMVPDCRLAVMTAAPNIAMEIALRCEHPTVIMFGGTLSRNELSVSDPEIETKLNSLNIDTAFITASGYDAQGGFSVGSQLTALLKRAVVRRARKTVMLLDTSKIGSLLPFTFARPEEIDILIMEDPAAALADDGLKKIKEIL